MIKPVFALILVIVCLTGCGGSPTPPVVRKGKPAPDFTFADLLTGKESALSDLKGKVVVVDFWASWCGPCQKTMDHLQTYPEKHPEWGDRVVILSVSIDEKLSVAKSHLKKKNWDKSRNTWIDPEGGKNPIVLAYAGKGIPAAYIIDAEGILMSAGHPERIGVSKVVGDLLSANQ